MPYTDESSATSPVTLEHNAFEIVVQIWNNVGRLTPPRRARSGVREEQLLEIREILAEVRAKQIYGLDLPVWLEVVESPIAVHVQLHADRVTVYLTADLASSIYELGAQTIAQLGDPESRFVTGYDSHALVSANRPLSAMAQKPS